EQAVVPPVPRIEIKKEEPKPAPEIPKFELPLKEAQPLPQAPTKDRGEVRRKMTKIRKVIAERLVEAKNTTAMLTTFNEVDMSHIMGLREKYKEEFQKKHGVKLGFMSFFVEAVTN